MLPDFPRLKRDISRLQRLIMKARLDTKAPILQMVRRIVQEEGNKLEHQLEDGARRASPYSEVSAPFTLNVAEIGTISLSDFQSKIEETVEELARQTMTDFFHRLNAATEQAGTAVHAGGKPWSPESMLQGLETIDMSFDESGRPQLTLLMHPDMLKRIYENYPNFEEDPAYKARYEEIIRKKKREWLDRESDRRLVD